MANVKFYKGELKNIPATAKSEEGRIYFAYSTSGSGTDIKYSPEGIYLDLGTEDKKRLKMTTKSDFATNATNDGSGYNIRDTYLKSLKFADAGTNLIMIKGSGAETKLAIPVASVASAGIVSTEAQTFAGTKTFSNIIVTSSRGFNYSGIEPGTANAARSVWYADSTERGTPVVSDNFTFNPATGTLTAANFNGLATKATYDSTGNQAITSYLRGVTISGQKITFTKGSGETVEISTQDLNNKVTQTAVAIADYTNWRTILWGASNSATEGFAPTTITDGTFTSANLSFQPSSGTLRATTFKGNLSGNATTATKATKDSSGNDINLYFNAVSASEQKLTFTRGTGAKVEVTTQDKNVYQQAVTASDYTNWRTVLWGASNSGTEGFTPTDTTGQTFATSNLSFQPSTGTLRATIFKGSLSGNASTASSATKATQDSSGNTINTTYPTITSMSFSNPSATVAQLNFKDGSGKAHTAIAIPAATGSLAGILTAAAQTIGGAKTFTGAMTVNSTITSNDIIQGTILCATSKMPLASGKVTSLKGGTSRVYSDGIAISNPATPNDVGWIRVTGTGESDTVLEIATGDDGGTGEQIVIRQYNTSNTVARYLTLLDTAGRSYFRDIYPQSVNSFSLGSSAARFLNGYIDHTKVIDLEVASKVTLKYNSDNACLDFVFA